MRADSEVGSLDWLKRQAEEREKASREQASKAGEVKQLRRQLRELLNVPPGGDLKTAVQREQAEAQKLKERYEDELHAFLKVEGKNLGG